MEIKIEVSKYDILGIASMLGVSEKSLEDIEKYINEHESMKIDLVGKSDEGYTEYKTAMAALVVAQISKDLDLK